MAPIPTRDTTLAAHWVRPGSAWHAREQAADGRRLPGYDAVCGERVVEVSGDDADYGPPRPYCSDCQQRRTEHTDALRGPAGPRQQTPS